MLLLVLVALVTGSRIQKMIRPGVKEVYYAVLGERDIELNIQLNQYTDTAVQYRITRGESSEFEGGRSEELIEPVNEKYTLPGTYRIEVENVDSEMASISIYSNVMKSDEVDNDNLAIKNLFIDLEGKLTLLYNTNMRLKTIQERNIMEARRMRNGLYVMFGIPIMYVVIGFGKLHGIKMMFAPRRSGKI